MLRSQYAPLVQSHAFSAALTHLGRPPLRFALSKGRGEVQIIRRHVGPWRVGLVSRTDIPRDDLERVAAEAGCVGMILNAETPAGGHGVAWRSPTYVAELDIKAPLDVLRKGLRQKWRNRLNRADALGLKLSETALYADHGHWLLDMERAQARMRGYANWPSEITVAFAKTNKAQARLFEARQTGEVIAALLFLCHGSVATYHIGWTGGAGRGVGAHQALMWYAIARLQARGVERLDLGAIETDRAPGLARFKLGTGAQLRALGGTWLAMPRFMRQRL
ncbi:GNAT family N-acetyltransferase [Roseobacteraceae bacterium S113]